MTAPPDPIAAPPKTPGWVRWFGRHIERHPRFWRRLAAIESWFLEERLADIRIDRPVYVCGLARSGTTAILERLSTHPDMTGHQYRDFPFVYTPYWWNWFLRFSQTAPSERSERLHGDRIHVTPDSPEAMEESFWMGHFPNLHDLSSAHILGMETNNQDFERFYADHIRKLILVRRASRYLAKNNYNVTRIGYLLRLFPDARIVVPFRSPVAHVASLVKQHRRFLEIHSRFPYARDHMRRVGHFEFGADRRPVHTGDTNALQMTVAAWDQKLESTGYAHQWAAIYDHVVRLFHQRDLANNVMVVSYDRLCHEPEIQFRRIAEFCELSFDDSQIHSLSHDLAAPEYYKPDLEDDEIETIHASTHETHSQITALAE